MPSVKNSASTLGTLALALQEDKNLAAFAQEATGASVATKTRRSYELAVETVGGYSALRFTYFLADQYAKAPRPEGECKNNRAFRYAAQTMRCYKSGCVHIAAEKQDRWHPDDNRMTEVFLNAYEATGHSPRIRGSLNTRQFNQYIAHCNANGLFDYADAAQIQWSAGVRPRDIDALCLDRVFQKDGDMWGVWAEIKAVRHLKTRGGHDFPHTLVTREGTTALKRQVAAHRKYEVPGGVPFFNVSHAKVSEMLRMLQVRHEWPADLDLDGPHVFRHSMAMDAYDRALKAAKDRGQWGSDDACRGYAVKGGGKKKAQGARQWQVANKKKRAMRA